MNILDATSAESMHSISARVMASRTQWPKEHAVYDVHDG